MAVTVKELLVQIKSDISKLHTEKADKKFDTTKSKANSLKSSITKLGVAFAGFASAAGAVQLFKGAIASASEFESALANVSTLVDTSAVNMGEYQNAILDMAGELGSATDLTQGLYQALSAGIEPAKAIEFVGSAAKFAKAALTDTYSAVDVLTTALNAYGMEAGKAGYVSDILFQTIKDGKITGEELAATMGNVIPTAVALGVNLETVAAGIATMTKHGIKAAEATTYLKNVFNTILNPAEEATAVAKSLGIEMSKAGVEGAGGFQAWLLKLKNAVGDNTALMTKMFPNIRALQAAFVLAGKGAGDFTTVLGHMETAAGNVDEAFEKQQETFSATMDTLKNEIEAVFIKTLLPALQDLAKWVKENKDDIIAAFEGIGEALKIVGEAVGYLAENFPTFSKQIMTTSDAMDILNKAEEKVNEELKESVEKAKLVAGVFSEVNNIGGLLGDAINDLTILFSKNKEEVEKTTQETDAYKKATSEVQAYVDKYGVSVKVATKKVKEQKEALEKLKEQFQKQLEALEKLNPEVYKSADGFQEAHDAIALVAPALDITVDATDDYAESTDKAIGKAKEQQKENQNLVSSFVDLSNSIGNSIGTLEGLGVVSSSFATKAKGITGAIGGIGAGFSQVASAGAGIGGVFASISGYIGIATAAATLFAGVIDLIIGKSGELEAVERRLYGLSGTSSDWGEKLEELAKQIGGAASAERAFNHELGNIIASSEITVSNFDQYIRRIREIVAVHEWAGTSIDEVERDFGKAFAAIVKNAEELGLVGGDAMIGLIELAKEWGFNIKEVNEYIETHMKAGLEGYKNYLAGEFSDVTLGVFEDMITYQAKVADNQALIDGVHGLADAMINLSAATRLNEEQYQAFEDAAQDAYDTLITQGFTAEEAVAEMAPLLSQLAFLQKEFGYHIDESTQKLIDQGIEQGVISADMRTNDQKMLDLQERMTKALEKMARIYEDELTNSMQTFTDSAESSWRSVSGAIDGAAGSMEDFVDSIPDNVTISTNVSGGGGGAGGEPGAPPGFQHGTHGRYIQMPTRFMVGESGREMISRIGTTMKVDPMEDVVSGRGGRLKRNIIAERSQPQKLEEITVNLNSLDAGTIKHSTQTLLAPILTELSRTGNFKIYQKAVIGNR